MKYLLFIVLLVTVLITAGCMSGNQNTPVTPTSQIVNVNPPIATPTPQIMNVNLPIATPTPQIVYVTVTVPVSAPTSIVPVSVVPISVETVCNTIEHSTTNIKMIGNVYGLASAPADGIDEIRFTIGLAPCSSTIDLTQLQIVLSTPNAPNVTLTQSTRTSTGFFTTKIGTTKVTSLTPGDQVEITFFVTPVSANTKMNIELKPSVGAVLPFSKTAPAKIAATNVL
ncbi:MAG: flagellin [Methanoregula sp.]|nr:flagellin [Methanoregula sp.]